MGLLPPSLDNLTAELARLPGVGPKSAQRLAFHLMTVPADRIGRLAETLVVVSSALHPCARCGFIAQAELCSLCGNPRREPTVLCVVQDALDVLAIERSAEFGGLYHVLGGAISPLDGIGPAQLNIASLLARVSRESVAEVILAMDPNVEGEATAHYLVKVLQPLGVRVSRVAQGLPAGADIQYADELTMARALRERRPAA